MEAAMAQLLLATMPPTPLLFQGTPLPDKTCRASMGVPPVELGSALAPRGAHTRGASGVKRIIRHQGVLPRWRTWMKRKRVSLGWRFIFLPLDPCSPALQNTLQTSYALDRDAPRVYAPRGAKADPQLHRRDPDAGTTCLVEQGCSVERRGGGGSR